MRKSKRKKNILQKKSWRIKQVHRVVTVPETHNTFEITDFTESGNGSKILKLTLAYVCLFVYLLLIVYFVFAFFSSFACLFVLLSFFLFFPTSKIYEKSFSLWNTNRNSEPPIRLLTLLHITWSKTWKLSNNG